jgi:hypothetical protein
MSKNLETVAGDTYVNLLTLPTPPGAQVVWWGNVVSITMTIKDSEGTATILTRAVTKLAAASNGDGRVSITWQSGDPIFTKGVYRVMFTCLFTDGTKLSFPNQRNALIRVR